MSGAPMRPARAISVDLDGTLYRVRRLRVAWRLRHERGLLLAWVAAREKLRHEGPFDDLEALERREAELVAPSFELTVEDALSRLSAVRKEMPEALTRGVPPYRGVRAALLAAHSLGIKLAVISDYDPREKLTHLGLDTIPWAAQVAADGCGALKPHPKSFERALSILGLEGSDVVHVGDREDADVEGALAAGLRAWRFAPRGATNSKAERTFSRWAEDLFAPLAP